MSDQAPDATSATDLRARRRRCGLIGTLLLLVASYVLPPLIARPILERALASALSMPVSIPHLWWRPWAGEVTASRLLLGAEQHQVSVDRLTIDADLARVVQGEIVLDRVVFDKPLVTVVLDARYRPEIRGFSGDGASESRLPDFVVRQLLVNGGVLTLRYPVQQRTRDAKFQINRLAAADVSVRNAGGELEAAVELAGSLDGASLNGEAKLRLAAANRKIDAKVGIKGFVVNRNLIDLPASLQTFSGKVDALAKYEADRSSPSGSLVLELRIEEPHFNVGAQTELGAMRVSMPNTRVDFDKSTVDLGTVTAETPLFTVTLNDAGVARAAEEEDNGAASAWTVKSGEVDLRGGKIQVRRGAATTTLALKAARWGGVAGHHPTAVAADAEAEGGGAVVLRGTLAVAPLNAALNVHLDGLVLTPLAQLVPELPVTISKGTLQGTLDLDYKNGSPRVLGNLQASDLRTAPPAPNRDTQVMAIHTATVEFVVVPTASPWLDVSSLKLSYPYLMAERTSRGLFPVSLFSGTDDTPPARSARTANGDPISSVRLHQVEIDGGKLEFMDSTLNPAYWASLTDISMRLNEALLPALTIGRFEITGKEDEISPTEIAGMLTPEGLEGRAAVTDLLLESMNPYVAAILGYKATAGRMSLHVVASPAPPLLKTTTDLVAGSIGVEQTGVDLIQSQSGVPLRIALSLLKNLAGEVTLQLPVAVDTSARSVEVGSIVGQAIRSAIVSALTSPLRLLGSLFGVNGAPHAFAIDPIPFAVGSGSVDAMGQERIAQVARILQSHPGLILVAMPQITAADIEQVGADGARDLAEKRNAAVRSALVSASTGPRLEPNRLMLVAWEPSAAAKAIARPGVYVELQAQ
jgi:hypothetical protein